jgi:hypothetical protein
MKPPCDQGVIPLFYPRLIVDSYLIVYDSKAREESAVYRTGIKILKATVGIESNSEELLPSLPPRVEVKSLLTDFNRVERVPYSTSLDGRIRVEESETEASIEFSKHGVKFKGPLLMLAEEASDLRYSLWGNQGFLYRYVLHLLEEKHDIFNFHACGLYDEGKDELYIVIGGAGSGKTVYLLSGLERGLKLYSTETVHFRIDRDNITWFIGSIVDNIRLGTLIHHFPKFLPDEKYKEEKQVWQKKIALDLSSYRMQVDELKNPRKVTILFPRIEEGKKDFILSPIDDKRKAAKTLFDNISQKLSETVVLYDKIPVLGIDDRKAACRRLEKVGELVNHRTIARIASVISSPYDCWGDLLG